ncbi:hypothetical protein NC797_17860 [Aquibacillus sp. 3ASR75-11]|uniref:Uncharacterized protein n=1 Tax=Terrihalobacillus insolitus TaxID=2950438 RepID=A0A9X3WZV6_9BACI|nr:hypothetical protein [Terrihalobacillus insolitus]MDC3426334.1 hypothetical protein [Terrihalobacillus insolitus]
MNNYQTLQKMKTLKHNHSFQLKHQLDRGKYNPRTRSWEKPLPKDKIEKGNAF